MKFDLEKEGLETLFKPWQIRILDYLWDRGSATSREIWKYIMGTDTPISRASVIFFLNEMTKEGFVKVKIITGRGGMKGLYSPAMSKDKFLTEISMRIVEKVNEALLSKIEE